MNKAAKNILHTLITGACLSLISPVGAEDVGWVDLTENLMASIDDFQEGPNALMNGIGALGVDRNNGGLYVFVQMNGLYKSEDQGETFFEIAEAKVQGRMMGGSNISLDPHQAGRVAFFSINAQDQVGAGAMTLDGGKTVTVFQKPEIDGFTAGAVTWEMDNPQTIIARQHHGREKSLWLSRDAGQSWINLDVNGWQPGLCGPQVLLTGAGSYRQDKPGILRSNDGGQTWEKVHEAMVRTLTPQRFEDTLYWITDDGLLISTDQGASWTTHAQDLQEPFAGPFFGKTQQDILLATAAGPQISRDGGQTWQPLFPGEGDADPMLGNRDKRESIARQSYGWDPERNLLYATKRNGQLLRRQFDLPRK